jgi:hypothetical protein
MRRAWLAVVILSAVALAFFAGRWSRAGAVEECATRAAQLERERDEARSQRGSQLASALALASRGLEQSRRDPRAPAPTVPGEKSGASITVGEDQPDAGGRDNIVSMMFAAKDKARVALDKMQRATRLSSDQRAGLDQGVAAMNLALGDAVERFAKFGGKEPRIRELLPIALDALNALKKADDDFRNSLDSGQQRDLDTDGFEVVSQIDPMIFLRFLTPPAATPSP